MESGDFKSIKRHQFLKKKMKKKNVLNSNIKYKKLTKKSGFKKSYFFYSKQHQNYINFDKKYHQAEGNFLYSKFVTYINVIPYSRPPFFLAMYLGFIAPQMLFLFNKLKKKGSSLNWVKIILSLTIFFALLNLFYWFFDLFIETHKIGKHNQKINASLSYGFTIFMLSEVCVFGGLFWGFFDRAFHPSVSLQSLYMPSGTHGLPTLGLVFRGSFLLSLSCTAFNAMKRALMLGENNRARVWGFFSFCIGLSFLFQQIEEYQSIPYMMSLNAHCSYFYAITGLHGFHVAIGIMFIGTILDRINKERFNQYELMSVTFAEIYWYFVDLVWFVLLLALYAYGLYHPNCVLYEKYTWLDQLKDYIYTVGKIFRDYLQHLTLFEQKITYCRCPVLVDKYEDETTIHYVYDTEKRVFSNQKYYLDKELFFLPWTEKIRLVTYFYFDFFNWYHTYLTIFLKNPLSIFIFSLKALLSIIFFFLEPDFIDYCICHYSVFELFFKNPKASTDALINFLRSDIYYLYFFFFQLYINFFDYFLKIIKKLLF